VAQTIAHCGGARRSIDAAPLFVRHASPFSARKQQRVFYPARYITNHTNPAHAPCAEMTQSLQDFYNILRNIYLIYSTYRPLLRIMMQYPIRGNGTLDLRQLRGVSYDIMTI
jgi:hypothetical protein